MEKFENLFCTRPFTWMEIGSDPSVGDCFLCSPDWLNMPVGNLENSSVEKVWNSKKAQQIRESILDGTFKYCNTSLCPALINRQDSVLEKDKMGHRVWKQIIEKNLVKLPYGPKHVSIAHDRSCNLHCPSCRTEYESPRDNTRSVESINEKIKKDILPGMYSLCLSSMGDPFGSPLLKKWIRSLKKEDVENLRQIELQTNGVLWTPKNWDALDPAVREKITSAGISIDAASAKTYSLNRVGGDFNILLKNLRFISNLRQKGVLHHVNISMVVQTNNYREMKDFVFLGEELGFDCVYFSRLTNWGTFTDEEYKSRAVFHKDHPDYEDFKKTIEDDVFKSDIVYMGNVVS